ncbi:MAG: hypothetical protein FWH27_15875 [Planctomycetaceae bacterium]|nr:hypothetical protein [Planctomycetaceae bacterium]
MRKIVENILDKRAAKAIVDVLLLIGLVLVILTVHSAERSWWSFHCIISMTWYVLMLVHICQHWRMTKLLLKLNRKALKRNTITLLTVIAFILMTFCILLFIIELSEKFVHIHHVVASPFRLVIVVHTITKIKQFVACFR